MSFHLANPERLVTVLREPPAPVFLLGAGASASSGVPLASTIIRRAAKWAYAKAHGEHPDDPKIQPSDWHRWLIEHPWYVEDDPATNYPRVVEHLLQPRKQRAEFFRERVLDTKIPPKAGYRSLAELLHRRAVHTVLTTNFDRLIQEAARSVGRPHFIETVQVPSDDVRFSTAAEHPQLVFLHGSVEHYTDKNMLEEIQQLRAGLADLLVPLLRDRPLVVVGYRGAEPSVMNHLLIDNAEATGLYKHGIYWCTRDGVSEDGLDESALHPLVHQLAQTIGGNFSAVPIRGFDELVADTLWPRFQAQPDLVRSTPRPAATRPAPTPDMTPVEGFSLDDLDLTLARARVIQYCEAIDIPVPATVGPDWIVDQMIDQNLVRRRDGTVLPTLAGYVLFGKRPQAAISSARTRIRFSGPKRWLEQVLALESDGTDGVEDAASGTVDRIVEGTLWNQLDRVSDALALVNRPFRLKGEVSEPAFPYPPLLLKELLVNALVHRDFEVDEPVTVEVTPALIRFLNPGGLVEEVRRQVGPESIEEEIRSGHRGIKGYRNPVVTDLFYGAGNMDKRGSGLYDVLRLGADNGNEVQFGPTEHNDRFEATVFSRPEAVDDVTGTAPPVDVRTTRFAANTIEIVGLPETVWHAETDLWGAKQVYGRTGADWLPAFLTWSGRLFTFSDLDDPQNLLRGAISEPVETLALDEFMALQGGGGDASLLSGTRTGEDLFVWMLKNVLQRHLSALGLIVDKKRNRAYFPRSSVGPRKVTYQARVRRSTRTVVKARGSRKDGTPSYWEHTSIGYRFEKLADTWVLILVPGYVFTFNGRRGLLQSDRVNRLSTRRAARDYNSNVHHNLVFWLWVLSGGRDDAFTLFDGPSPDALDTSLPPGDDPDAILMPDDDSDGDIDNLLEDELDDEGYTDLNTSPERADDPERFDSGVRLRAALPTAAVHEVVIGDGEEGEADDDDDLADILAEEAEREREAAEADSVEPDEDETPDDD